MNTFFQRLKSRGGSAEKTRSPSLTLAAFGKHPGWKDHMPGIGVETDALAYVKQTLYEGGIVKQVDSDAWGKLDFEKRLEGFNHIFLWERAGHLLFGQLWSSSDAKGRSKYPMVSCVDGESVSAALLLGKAWIELERLQDTCKRLHDAYPQPLDDERLQDACKAEVTAECRASQERLRESISAPAGEKTRMAPDLEVRRRFIQHPDLGPDRVGFLRIMHELGISPANEGAIRHSHLRVPAIGGSATESLALWYAFFQRAVPKAASVLFIIRKDAQWLDIILQPTSDDFFCLQASLKALPLTTAIPYELPPELKPLLEQVESRFLVEAPVAVDPAPRTLANPPPTGEEKTSDTPVSRKPGKLIFPMVLLAGILIGVGFILLNSAHHGTQTVSPKSPPTEVSNAAVVKASEPASLEENYSAAMKVARAALDRKDYGSAVTSATAALGFKTNDSEATRLRADAQAQQRVADARAQGEEKYKKAMDSAQAAFTRADYASAIDLAETALTNKPNDEAALRFEKDARTQQNAVLSAQMLQRNYETALNLGGVKLNAGDYAGAVSQADAALASKPNDSAALKLKADAAAALAQQRQKDYESAMEKGRTAMANKQYPEAAGQAVLALQIKPGDAAAAELKNDAQVARQNLSAQIAQNNNYQKAMAAAQSSFDAKDYAKAVEQADLALSFRTNDSAAVDLKQRSSEMRDLPEAQRDFERGEYDQAMKLCTAHSGSNSFSALAEQIKHKKLSALDSKLELYLVLFGILDPKNAKTKEAQSPEVRRQSQELTSIILSLQDIHNYLSLVNDLEQQYKAGSWLDDERKKNLNILRRSIQNHQ